MTEYEALGIVLELAEQVLDEQNWEKVVFHGLVEEMERQEEAIELVEDMMNNLRME